MVSTSAHRSPRETALISAASKCHGRSQGRGIVGLKEKSETTGVLVMATEEKAKPPTWRLRKRYLFFLVEWTVKGKCGTPVWHRCSGRTDRCDRWRKLWGAVRPRPWLWTWRSSDLLGIVMIEEKCVFSVCSVIDSKGCKGTFNTPQTASLPWCLQQLSGELQLPENAAELDCLYVCAHICGLVELN